MFLHSDSDALKEDGSDKDSLSDSSCHVSKGKFLVCDDLLEDDDSEASFASTEVCSPSSVLSSPRSEGGVNIIEEESEKDSSYKYAAYIQSNSEATANIKNSRMYYCDVKDEPAPNVFVNDLR